MDIGDFVVASTQQSLWMVLKLSGPIVGLALCVGLFISLIQATTQIQEQTLTFVPKLVTVMLALIMLGTWMLSEVSEFAAGLLKAFPQFL